MRFDDIRDPLVREAAERFVRDTGKPLHAWFGSPDEVLLRRLLMRRSYLADDRHPSTRPFDADLFEIRLGLRGLSRRQRKGLAYGDPVVIDIAAEMVMAHLRQSGITLSRRVADGQFRPPRGQG
jgi:hypothetical protein